MHEDALPLVFGSLRDKVRYVRRVSDAEFSSECPKCGGEPHADHEWPDRCRWFIDSSPRCWCRRCGYFAWADQLDGATPPSHDDLEKWKREQIARELERKRSAERALQYLRDGVRWQRYHDALDADSRRYWAKRGIPSAFIDWWSLGWCSDWTITHEHQAYHTPTATIPIFARDFQAVNIKHRLIQPPTPNDRYRYELTGQGQPLYYANPDEPLDAHVIAVEGEVKSMVVFVTLDDAKAQVVGLPGATPSKALLTQFEQAGRITLIFDPGALTQARELGKALGAKRVRILIPPVKVDDGILAGDLNRAEMLSILGTAMPL